MSDKNYEKYLEALRDCRSRRILWRAAFDLREECEETLKRLRKFEDKALHKWFKADKKLKKARNKFEEGLE